MQCVAVFGIKFKYLANFNAACLNNRSAAVRARVAFLNHADICNISNIKIAFRLNIYKVVTFFVCTAANIVHIHNSAVNYNGSFFQINASRAHVTADGSCCRKLFFGSHFQAVFQYAAGINNFNFVNLVVAAYKAKN